MLLTIATVIGGVGAYYWARRSGRRPWLWFVVGMFVAAIVVGVVQGTVRGLFP